MWHALRALHASLPSAGTHGCGPRTDDAFHGPLALALVLVLVLAPSTHGVVAWLLYETQMDRSQ